MKDDGRLWALGGLALVAGTAAWRSRGSAARKPTKLQLALQAAGFRDEAEAREEVRVASAWRNEIAQQMRAPAEAQEEAVRQAKAQLPGLWKNLSSEMAPYRAEQILRTRSMRERLLRAKHQHARLQKEQEAAAQRQDWSTLDRLAGEIEALHARTETWLEEHAEGSEESDQWYEPDQDYLQRFHAGIVAYSQRLPDAGWYQATAQRNSRFTYESRQEWLDDLRRAVERWFRDQPGMGRVPELRQAPTEQDLIELGQELERYFGKLHDRRARKGFSARFGQRRFPHEDARIRQHLALVRLAKLPPWALKRIGYRLTELPKDLIRATQMNLPTGYRVPPKPGRT